MWGTASRYARFAFEILVMGSEMILLKVMSWLSPSTAEKLARKILKEAHTSAIHPNDFILSYAQWNTYKFVCQIYYTSYVERSARINMPAPNPKLLDLDGVTQYRLLDFAKKGRPLVVNFGSCS